MNRREEVVTFARGQLGLPAENLYARAKAERAAATPQITCERCGMTITMIEGIPTEAQAQY